MKKLFYYLMLILPLAFVSCGDGKEDDEPGIGKYCVENKMSSPESENSSVVDGTLYSCYVFEFNSLGEIINKKLVGNVKLNSKTVDYVASENCSYVMLSFAFLPDTYASTAYYDMYIVADMFYITKGKTAVIKVTDNTQVVSVKDWNSGRYKSRAIDFNAVRQSSKLITVKDVIGNFGK